MITQGRRIYKVHPTSLEGIEPGDYWKQDGAWFGACPCPKSDDPLSPFFHLVMCGLAKHDVTEHEDGTITVSPSILVTRRTDEPQLWHGYLERGVWRSC